jgi:hypothetical protein
VSGWSWVLWLAFLTALVAIAASWAPAGSRVARVPWSAISWALFLAYWLLASGAVDLD